MLRSPDLSAYLHSVCIEVMEAIDALIPADKKKNKDAIEVHAYDIQSGRCYVSPHLSPIAVFVFFFQEYVGKYCASKGLNAKQNKMVGPKYSSS